MFWKLPGTANALIFFGFAFDDMTVTRDENARIRGMLRGKKSLGLLLLEIGEIDRAACTGATNSQRSTLPFHGFTLRESPLEFVDVKLWADETAVRQAESVTSINAWCCFLRG